MIYFVSDIHLGGGTATEAREQEQRFVAWLDGVSKDAEAIFLLGDIFDFWFEYKRVVPKGFVRTLGRLAALTDRGVRVVFVAGNHDQWVGDYLTVECGVEVWSSPRVERLNNQNVFLAHGHNMNIDGKPMLKLLNRIFASKILKVLFSWGIHPDLALRFGLWWSGNSRKKHSTGGGFNASLTDPLIAYAREYSTTHDVNHFIFGHMHFARDYRDGGLHVVGLGGWERHPSYAVLDAMGEITLHRL